MGWDWIHVYTAVHVTLFQLMVLIRNNSGSYRRPGQELQMKVHDNPQSVYIASAWLALTCMLCGTHQLYNIQKLVLACK